MKKFYTRLIVVIALLVLSATATIAQRPKMIFNEAVSSIWNTPQNWKRDGVQQLSTGFKPQNGDSLVILAGKSAVIAGSDASFTLSNVVIIIQAGGRLTIGKGSGGGANAGTLTLDNASAIGIEYDGTNRGELLSNTTGNTNNTVVLGSTTIFAGGTNYGPSFPSTGSGSGDLFGPARATSTSGGFTSGSLPVTLTGFGANLATGNKINISWKTQQEINTDHFEIQHSADGLGWQTIATVKASGFSSVVKSYSTSDAAPLKGANLYRLKTVDIDGGFSFSVIVNVRLNMFGKVSVFPNPSVGLVNVSLGEAATSDWTVSIINISGQIVVKKQFSKDQTTVSLPVSSYAAGHYTVEITDGVSKQSTALMIAHH